MNDIRKYVQLIESQQSNIIKPTDVDIHYLFTYDAERLYESSGISWQLLLENRVQWLRDNMMHKLEPIANKEGKTTEELFDWIIEQDPSKKKQYSQWLMKILVGKNAQSTIQDLRNATEVLSRYEELKNTKKLKPEHKDLNQFKSIADLKSAIYEAEDGIDKEKEAIDRKARSESYILHEDSEWIIVIPKTEYAAGYWGKNSMWCTATGFEGGRQEDRTQNLFDQYSKMSNLYTFVNKKDPMDIYQLSIGHTEFMNSENEGINYPETKKLLDISDNAKNAVVEEIINVYKENEDISILTDIKNMVLGYIPEEIDELVEDTLLTPEDAYNYIYMLSGRKSDTLEDLISEDARYSYLYAKNVIEGRFEKGEDAIATDAEISVDYARDVIKGRFEKGEDAIVSDKSFIYNYTSNLYKMGDRFEKGEEIIAKDVKLSLKYAKNVVKGRFEKGEDAIANSAEYSVKYAKDVIKGRFEKAEDAIVKSAKYSYLYAKDVIGGRFEKGEKKIATSAEYSVRYALDVIGGRFEKGEATIAKYAKYSYYYAKDVLKGRFEKGEDVIANSTSFISYYYARDVIKGRFEEGEDAIAQNADAATEYSIYAVKGRFEKGEDAIATHSQYSYFYAKKALKGRFEKGEDAIAQDAEFSYYYAKDVLKGRFEKGEDAMRSYLGTRKKKNYYKLTGIQL